MLYPENTKARLEMFQDTFGPISETAYRSRDNRIPKVDVYTVPPGERSNVWVYFTDGISDRRMNVPEKAWGAVPLRTELIAYSHELNVHIPEAMKRIVDFVFSSRTFLGMGHTYFFEHGTRLRFSRFVFGPPMLVLNVPPEEEVVPPILTIEGDEMVPLAMLPLTRKEHEYVRKNGPREVMGQLGVQGDYFCMDSRRRKSVV